MSLNKHIHINENYHYDSYDGYHFIDYSVLTEDDLYNHEDISDCIVELFKLHELESLLPEPVIVDEGECYYNKESVIDSIYKHGYKIFVNDVEYRTFTKNNELLNLDLDHYMNPEMINTLMHKQNLRVNELYEILKGECGFVYLENMFESQQTFVTSVVKMVYNEYIKQRSQPLYDI